jgi:acyl-CoA synthetase (AMP-forming)/AMP-acid ligase II
MNVISQFASALGRANEHPALVSGLGSDRRSLSYRELEARVDRAVQLLRQSGLRPGNKVLLAVPLSIETYIAMLAVLKAGLVIQFIDPAHGMQTLARCLRSHPPAAIIATPALMMLRLMSPELRRIPKRFTVARSRINAINICDGKIAGVAQAIERRSLEDSALLTFTSGSTGEPKAVIRTHGFLRNQFAVLRPVADLRKGDIDLVAMPMFALFNLASGITSVIPACNMKHPAKANPKLLLTQLQRENANRMVASPALLERLASYSSRVKGQLPAMACISTGGGPVGPALPGRLQAIAPGARIRTVYGSTEAEPISFIDHQSVSYADFERVREGAGLLVGKPVRGCDVRIIPNRQCGGLGPYTCARFDELTLENGKVGEIVVSGAHVLQGYADSSRDLETKFEVEGRLWHRTGDAGYFDECGQLWLAGRCNAAIRDDRGEVYPFQVEYAVAAIRGVRRAALMADNGKRLLVIETGNQPFAVDSSKIARCVADRSIDRIVTVRRIPVDKRHGAKIDYPALRLVLLGRIPRIRLAMTGVLARIHEAAHGWLRNARALLVSRRS